MTRATLRRDAHRSLALRPRYGLHQAVWDLFRSSGNSRPFLFRLVDDYRDPTLILSRCPPEPSELWSVQTRQYAPRLKQGEVVRFLLRASPTVKRGGKRHDLVMDARSQGNLQHRTDLAQELGSKWLRERLRGAEVQSLVVQNYSRRRLHAGRNIVATTCDFAGTLVVRDPKDLLDQTSAGIGPAKAFGCGLMLIRRPQ